MSKFVASQVDICSNARVKLYPESTVLQVANAPIFRESGWEAQKRAYDVPPKGQGKDPLRAQAVSRARARSHARDIALCNRFTHFFTLTLDGSLINRYDPEEVKRKTLTYLKNASYRKGFAYILLPEYHRDGAIHMHGLGDPGGMELVRANDPYSGKPLIDHAGRPVYNIPDWTWGFSSCVPIDGDYEKACNYITKYLTKDSRKIFGKWYLSSRNLVKRPETLLVGGGMDFFAFGREHPEISPVSLYRDIALYSCQLSQGGVALDIG